jgi:hypothetical protein
VSPGSVVVSSSPTVLQPGDLLNGQFNLKVQGTIGSNYLVQWSTDFVHWQTLQTGTLTNESVDVSDTNATSSVRFYRATPLP